MVLNFKSKNAKIGGFITLLKQLKSTVNSLLSSQGGLFISNTFFFWAGGLMETGVYLI